MTNSDLRAAGAPCYVAYVYPGWHRSAFRPEVDEWTLLDKFQPYFPGHVAPARPADGPYDDCDPAVAAQQIALASASGLSAFTYFLYFDKHHFILIEPVLAAIDAAQRKPPFAIGLTWCVRLPHDQFPIRRQRSPDVRSAPQAIIPTDAHDHDEEEEERALEDITLAELTELLGSEHLDEILLLLKGGGIRGVR